MTDRYLFRGFHHCENGSESVYVNGEWIKGHWSYGDRIVSNDKVYIHPMGNVFQVKESGLSSLLVLREVIPETVGQYTGRTDDSKNKVKIFSGDVVSFLRGKEKGYIVYDIKSCAFKIKVLGYKECWEYTTFDFEYGYEVVGSIHSNPDILERK